MLENSSDSLASRLDSMGCNWDSTENTLVMRASRSLNLVYSSPGYTWATRVNRTVKMGCKTGYIWGSTGSTPDSMVNMMAMSGCNSETSDYNSD